MMHKGVKNIIFDLGGVLLNLSYKNTENAFVALGIKQFNSIYSQAEQINLFDRFDKGEITAENFSEELRKVCAVPLTNEQINSAWNAMLLDFPESRINMLKSIKMHYRTFLLSNTNIIHMNYIYNYLNQSFRMKSFDSLFERVYLSYLIGMRKPDSSIFEKVLNENGLSAGETLFIDDSIQHINGAKKMGIITKHLTNEDVCSFINASFPGIIQ